MDDEVEAFIRQRYDANSLARDHHVGSWRGFSAAGLADRHFASELRSGHAGKFWQRV